MNDKVQRYIIEALAATGFCILAARVAFMLRPDVWATRINCGGDFSEAIPKLRQFLGALPSVSTLEVQLEGSNDWALVAFRSQNALMERIEQITGERVKAVRPWAAEAPAQPILQADGDPIPSWPCIARTEALRKAGIPDETYRQPARFAPPRKSL